MSSSRSKSKSSKS